MTTAHVELPGRGTPLIIDDDPWRDHHAALGAGVARRSRLAFAAAHVVMRDAYAASDDAPDRPGTPEALADAIDWETTEALRRTIAGHGLGIAEAMDTAQRFEIGWPAARRLIEATGRLDLPHGFVAGAGVDHLDRVDGPADLVRGVVEQTQVIRNAGGIAVILPMAWLARAGATPATYVETYRAIVREAGGPLLVHWLGAMFAPELAGYFPGDSFERVMDFDPAVVRGAKLSLLDPAREVVLRRRLLESEQILLTGDDLHFAGLISGDDTAVTRWTTLGPHDVALGDFSHALLGILDGIAAPAGLALRLLDAGETTRAREILDACETLSRIVFEPPTSRYKVALAFLAWLNGHQPNAMLVNHLEGERSRDHLVRVVEAAARAGAITAAGPAAVRLRSWTAG